MKQSTQPPETAVFLRPRVTGKYNVLIIYCIFTA